MDFYVWFIAALLFFILEIVTPGFVLMWFGVGALVSGLLDLAGVHNATVQVIVFVAVSILLVTLSRTIFKRFFMRASPGAGLKTNMDALIGKVGVVTERIDNELSNGRVLVEGQDWLARSSDNAPVDPGARGRITQFEGARLTVERL